MPDDANHYLIKGILAKVMTLEARIKELVPMKSVVNLEGRIKELEEERND